MRALDEGLLLERGGQDTPLVLGSPGYRMGRGGCTKRRPFQQESLPQGKQQRKRRREGDQALALLSLLVHTHSARTL